MVAAAVSYVEDGRTSSISISQADLKALFRQAELDLYRSKAFRQALETLEDEPGQSGDVQSLLRQACKEAIRLALRQVFVSSWGMVEQLVKGKLETDLQAEPPVSPQASSQIASSDVKDLALAVVEDNQPTAEPAIASELTLIHQAQNSSAETSPRAMVTPSTEVKGRRAKARQTQQTQRAQQLLKREEVLRQLGRELKQVRELRSLSVAELHQQTRVPMHHIKAIEAGDVVRLPEDIYVRGFIRQIGDALDLNGAAIANLIPLIDTVMNPVPSWYHEQPSGDLHHLHLYVGYTALIAGTMGSLVLMNQQPFDATAISQNLEWLNVFQPSETKSNQEFEVNPMINGTGVDAIAPPDTAAPESSPPMESFNGSSFTSGGDRLSDTP
jgi:hypothetical protein